jgi:lysophospholipase L1-like esterase
MRALVRDHPRLAAAAGVVALAILFLLLRTRNNAWPITNEHPQGVAIVAFGDSLTAGYQVADADSYPAQLAQLVGREVLNRGVSGDSTADGLARLDRDVLSENPRVVLLSLGANDMLRRQPIEQTFANLRRIVDRIQARGALVVLIGVEGYPLLHGDYGKRYRDLARETGCVYVPDVLDDVLGEPALMYDQIHPNGAGYAKIARRIQAEAGEYLSR